MVGLRLLVMIMAALLVAAAPADAQKKKRKKPPKPLTVQLLAINDFHGYLRANPPGRVSRSGDPEATVPAGGIEYLATQIRRLKRRNANTLVVAAGDLVGGCGCSSSSPSAATAAARATARSSPASRSPRSGSSD
jgi:2',3'-cyclic-nucleotide 2'-phosphodiesterase (5'-nucleotidase family)